MILDTCRLLTLLGATTGLLGAGCLAPLHEPPAAGQPAATLKFRVNHLHYPGGSLRFRLWIDQHRLPIQTPLRGPAGTWTRAKPGWRRLDLGSFYFSTYSVPVTYTASESYRCGNSTCFRSVTRTRYDVRTQVHGQCYAAHAVYLQNGQTYLIGYSYLGSRMCRITCHRQVFTENEQFRLEPCPWARPVATTAY